MREGVLEKYGVEMIGATHDAINKAEDREPFKRAIEKAGLEYATLGARAPDGRGAGGAGGDRLSDHHPALVHPGRHRRRHRLQPRGIRGAASKRGLSSRPTHELLIEESLIGWKEFEMEVVRDRNDNCIIVCSIENLDPMGVHTGDSITVAPAQTLTDKEYQIMRDASIAVLREIGVETGGSNVQFAINPKSDGCW
ncbi:MAG: hypothetical protein MPW15_23160 [Candidatus Manganitrophus sp.]|nr:hypothetical protein [Candidatus Manganitrophus sp.]